MVKYWSVFVALIMLSGCSVKQVNVAVEPLEQNVTRIFLTRHAEKLQSDGKDPALSKKGLKRANALSERLQQENVEVIYSTNYLRTQMTAQPLAEALELEINAYYMPLNLLAKKLTTINEGQTILVVGHSNTTPQLIKELGVKNAVEINHDQYGDLYLVEISKDSIIMTQEVVGN